ncbi:MAG: hypothetical protein U9Q62_01805 [Campylobacterota bacterium]|nr:hypothetical protein [Campylobacterota bacterium]
MTYDLLREHSANRVRFILSSVLFLFAFIFQLTNTGLGTFIFIVLMFTCFLRNGIRFEMSSRSLSDDHGGH